MATLPAAEDDVEKILTGMMSKKSPLIKGAETAGFQAAQSVGLGQSTMGIKAAQAAAYNAAMPLASQQGQQGHQTNLQREQFGQQTEMQGKQFGHETGMQTAGFQHAATQAELDRAATTKNIYDTGYLDRLKMHEGAALEGQQKALDRSLQERIAGMEISAQNKERVLASLGQSSQAWSQSFASIAGNPELPSDVRNQMLASIDTMRNHQQNLTTALMRSTVGQAW